VTRRRTLITACVLLIGGMLGWWWLHLSTPKAAQAVDAAASWPAPTTSPPVPIELVRGMPATAPVYAHTLDERHVALARAYARRGAARDKTPDVAFASDPDALEAASVAEADRLLDEAPLRRGPGLPSTSPIETLTILPQERLVQAASAAPFFGTGPEAIAPERVAATLAGAQIPEGRGIDQSKRGPVMTTPGVWADVRFRASVHARTGLIVGNRSAGEYAIEILANDYGSIRLDGGLVVPGRYYRVRSGIARITGDVDAHVTIRPLSAVHVYVEAPTPLPQSSG
jgi:hypothetical protein